MRILRSTLVRAIVAAITASTATLGLSLTAAHAGTQACTFYDTKYAEGSGTGDALYGYTTNLGTKAAAHAHSTALVYQNRIAYVSMLVGHRLLFTSNPPGLVANGRVLFDWQSYGSLATSTDTSFFTTASASAHMQLTSGVLDETTGQQQTAIEWSHFSSGQHSQGYADVGYRQYAVTYVDGHVYRPFLRLDGDAQAQGTVLNPLLQADALADYLGGGNGAFITSGVTYSVDLPDNYTMTCTP